MKVHFFSNKQELYKNPYLHPHIPIPLERNCCPLNLGNLGETVRLLFNLNIQGLSHLFSLYKQELSLKATNLNVGHPNLLS